jgi:hypothetical protein
MKLEKLVADRELCEQIQAGEFEDSAFIFVKFKYTEENAPRILPREHEITKLFADDFEIYPAPMLEEIMAAMPYCRVYKKTTGTFIAVHEKTRFAINKNGAAAALKLWLEMNKK